MAVKKFLFDLGNVFFDWSPERVLKPMFGDDEKMKFFINNVSFPLLDGRCDACLLYTSPSPRDTERSRMPSSA